MDDVPNMNVRGPILQTRLAPATVILLASVLFVLMGVLVLWNRQDPNFALLWYGNAIAAAGLLLLAHRHWPVMFAAAAAATFLTGLAVGFTALQIACFIPGNLAAIWLSASWIAKVPEPGELTRQPSAFTRLLLRGMMVPALAGAAIDSALLQALFGTPVQTTFLELLLADLNGFAAVLPLALAAFPVAGSARNGPPLPDDVPEPFAPFTSWQKGALLWVISAALTSWAVFGSRIPLASVIAAASLIALSKNFLSATLLTALLSLTFGLSASNGLLAVQSAGLLYWPGDLLLALLMTVLVPTFMAVVRQAHLDALKRASAYAAAVEAERTRFRRLFSESPDAYLVISATRTVILDCNAAAEAMLKTTRDQIVGMSPAIFEPEFQPDGMRTVDVIARVLREVEQGGTSRVDMLRTRADGTEFWVTGSVSQSVDRGEQVNLWIWQDITERKRLEHELRKAREVAEQANRAKSDFLATMSHEIRTPLNAIVSTSALLQQGALSTQQKKDFETIESASRSLMMVVDDVLDLSRIEAGEFTLENRAFSLADLIEDLVRLFEAPLAKKNVQLVAPRGLAGIPRRLIGDADCLRHILTNLLSNAMKFTSEGAVMLRVAHVPADEAEGRTRIRFEIEDTGIGISPENQRRLFRAFSQADTSTRRKFGGTGLGLSIVKRLVELMDGTFGVESAEGRGSTFWLEVAFAQEHAGHGAAGSMRTDPGLRVGYLGGREADAARLAAICAGFGWRLIAAGSATDLNNEDRPDCLVIGDGEASATSLSRAGPIVVRQPDLSSDGAALQLFNALCRAFHESERGSAFVIDHTDVGAAGVPWLQGITIMVVDDSDTNRSILSRILESHGAVTQVFESGAEAVSHARGMAADIDIVLMDLQMPDMDGCDATMLLKEVPGARHIPVIALTAGATTTERERALASGMVDFLLKPVKAGSLIRTILKHVEVYRKRPVPMLPVTSDGVESR